MKNYMFLCFHTCTRVVCLFHTQIKLVHAWMHQSSVHSQERTQENGGSFFIPGHGNASFVVDQHTSRVLSAPCHFVWQVNVLKSKV